MTSGDKMEEAIQSKKSILLEYLKVIVITLIVTYGILYFVQISRVYGTSMIPTYHEGNIVLVDKVFYKNKEAQWTFFLFCTFFQLFGHYFNYFVQIQRKTATW